MHLEDGVLRAFQDGQLDAADRRLVENHLSECPVCRQQLEISRHQAERVARRFGALAPGMGERPISHASARQRLAQRDLEEQRSPLMRIQSIWTHRRILVAVLTFVTLMVLAAAFPSVRAIAGHFLGLFRVQQIAIVPVNPANFPNRLGSSSSFEQFIAQDLQVEQFGERERVSGAEAARSLGFSPRLPDPVRGARELWLQPGARVTFSADLARFQQILQEMDREDLTLPPSLEGAEITLEVPDSLLAGYGECTYEQESREMVLRMTDCITFLQMPSPTVSAPAELDIAAVGQAFLQVMGLSEAEAQQFSQSVDWATTLVLPIPQHDASYRPVQVDGVEGTLIQQHMDDHAPEYTILWLKDEIVYVLTGFGAPEKGLMFAEALDGSGETQ